MRTRLIDRTALEWVGFAVPVAWFVLVTLFEIFVGPAVRSISLRPTHLHPLPFGFVASGMPALVGLLAVPPLALIVASVLSSRSRAAQVWTLGVGVAGLLIETFVLFRWYIDVGVWK